MNNPRHLTRVVMQKAVPEDPMVSGVEPYKAAARKRDKSRELDDTRFRRFLDRRGHSQQRGAISMVMNSAGGLDGSVSSTDKDTRQKGVKAWNIVVLVDCALLDLILRAR